jgi:hypothetical protein
MVAVFWFGGMPSAMPLETILGDLLNAPLSVAVYDYIPTGAIFLDHLCYNLEVRSFTSHTTDTDWMCMYTIRYTQTAIDDLKTFRKHEQQVILAGISEHLSHEPTIETRNRNHCALIRRRHGSCALGMCGSCIMLMRQFRLWRYSGLAKNDAICFSFAVERRIYDDMELSYFA